MSGLLWVDKYRPKSLAELDKHPEVTAQLRGLVATGDFPHLLVYGPPGAGKKTRVMAFLAEKFGATALQVKLDHKAVSVTDSKTVEIATLSSPHHVEINPSDAGPTYDRVIVMNTIRDIASTVPMTSTGQAAGCKVVVLNEVEKLSRGAQQALRRTMEKYVSTCRLVLVCASTSRLIPPLKSRCLSVRVPGHGADSVASTCRNVCEKERIPAPSEAFATTLAERSGGNLRRGLLMLEAAKMSGSAMSGDGRDIPQPDWIAYVAEIARDILTDQTPKRLYEVRQKYYELLSQCIPAEMLLRELVRNLLAFSPPNLRPAIVRAAAKYDHQLKLGSKPIMHLEAFTAHVMAAQKQCNIALA
uniref:AAA+ ATPase domain-containing protein n=1 Tax=Neobodo designis TaxID=312471 RepID=A0A7S1LPC1_NEODS|mmetsp:Transcript_25839/g.79744  ORF Transcript_25839/g.79744 Transcript_25839/m.79744 type:complete len:358 (+) Transcript_25839:24-1097(+)